MANRRMISPAWLVPSADLFHASNQMRRATGHGKLTGTIHDVTSWLMPDLHRSGTLIADREYAELIWKRADGLIAVSHKSKQDAVEVLGIAADKITVVYHGIADSYFEVTAAQISKMREIYRIQKPYVLFLSTIEPRKNLDRLITAYESMSNATRSEFDLLVGGPYGWNSEATMQRLVQSPKGVRYLGYVPEHHLPALFAGATLFVYPSLYEGFGLPVLQSMAAGTPVLLSFAGALPEIAADCAAYIDPYSADDLSNGLTRMLLSPSERVRFSEAGRLRAARFQWTACAHQTWEFFQNIIGM